ncbi:AraC family ligand binding domain-containing protein [Dyadobacter crusticola]|uniref:AraC family ligand binding domain-containing protein n=1 Tax=Dyadobacter crusticola TaxID=292407 RepID=UPI0004E18E71|nr:AraC family ligand binding domain-containing protein [Dyadobacter crusticola]
MEIKSNQSTQNRPEGDRILNAPYVFSDIPMYLEQLRSEKSWEKNDRNAITVFKSDKITIVLSILQAGAAVSEHAIDECLTCQVLSGELKVEAEGRTFYVTTGQMMTFHAHLAHSIQALEDSEILITTYKA